LTCPICDDLIEVDYSRILRFCKCRCLGVDSAKEYTRYLGVIPVECPGFEAWRLKNESIIKEARREIGLED
jgi:hypothetical protein